MGITKNKRRDSTLKGVLKLVGFIGLFVLGAYLLAYSFVAITSSDTGLDKSGEYDLKVEFCNIIGCKTYYCDEVKEIFETKYELHRDDHKGPYLVVDVNEDINVKVFRTNNPKKK